MHVLTLLKNSSSLHVYAGGALYLRTTYRTMLLLFMGVFLSFSSVSGQNNNCLCSTTACTVSLVDFSTGVEYQNAAYVQVPVGNTDPNWFITNSYLGASMYSPFVITSDPTWNSGLNNGQWIAPNFTIPSNVPFGVPYTFERCFEVCSPAATVLPFRVFAHEEIVAVRINGSTLYSSTGYVSGSTDDFVLGVPIPKQQVILNQTTEVCLQIDVNQHTDYVDLGIMVSGTAKGQFPVADCSVSMVSGVKYHDRNANGIQDYGDSYLKGWDIELRDNATNQVIQTATTNAFGNYTFTQIPPGSYTIEEVMQSGWAAITPSGGSQQLNLGNCDTLVVNFGNRNTATTLSANNTCSNTSAACAATEINLTTGVDHANNTLFAGGSSDAYWRFTNVPTSSSAMIGDQATVITNPNAGWNNSGPNSTIGKWIGPSSGQYDDFLADASCSYTYQRYFSTCDDDWVSLNLSIFGDNTVQELRIDGVVVATFPYSNIHFSTGVDVNSSVFLSEGRHCLEIDMRNIGGTTPTGFKVEGSIFGSSLISDDCLSLANCDAIIPLRMDMFRNNLAGNLVNEQSSIGDPVNGNFGNPNTEWHNACWPVPCPAEVDILDLDQEHDLCGVYLYYDSGNAAFEIDYLDVNTGTWVNVFNAVLTQDVFVPINATTTSLRFTNNRHADVDEIVLYGSASYLRDSHIIPVDGSMVTITTNHSNQGSATDLFDEQASAGDPINGLGGTPSNPWEYSCWNGNQCPHALAELDLGRTYKIDALSFFDGQGNARFIIEYDDNGTWVTLFDGPTDQYNEWRNLDLLNIYTSKLRFSNTQQQSQVNEIVLYGSVAHCAPANSGSRAEEPLSITTVTSKKVSVAVYPNPTTSDITLTLDATTDEAHRVTLFSTTGQSVFEQTVDMGIARFDLPMNHLPSGTYYLQITSDSGQVIEKIIKQ